MGDPVAMDVGKATETSIDDDALLEGTGKGSMADAETDGDAGGGMQVGARSEKVGTLKGPVSARSGERRPRRARGSGSRGLMDRAAEFRAQAKEFRTQAESESGHHADNLRARADRADAAADRMEAAAGRSGGATGSQDSTIGDDAAGEGMDTKIGDGMSDDDTVAPGSGGTVIGSGGQIILEAEDGSSNGAWVRRQVDGRNVMVWAAKEHSYFDVKKSETMSYNFEADKSGNFNVGLNSARLTSDLLKADRGHDDKGNDVYFQLTDLTTGKVVKSPTKFVTYFGKANDEFRMGDLFDVHGTSKANVNLVAGNQYRLDIIGRSPGFALDKIVLSQGALPNDAKNLTASRTVGGPATDTDDVSDRTDTTDDQLELALDDDVMEDDDAVENNPMDGPSLAERVAQLI